MGLLLSGIPGTGKSAFSRWLVEHHGFVHFDVDVALTLPQLADLARPRAVLDWGFPADDRFALMVEEILKYEAVGVHRWWFDGDRDAALQSHLGSGKPKAAWDHQVPGIQAHWSEIEALYPGHILHVISAGPSYMTNEERFARVFPVGVGA